MIINRIYSPLKCSRPTGENEFHLRCTTPGEPTLIFNKEWECERTIPRARMTTCSTRTTGSEALGRTSKSVKRNQYIFQPAGGEQDPEPTRTQRKTCSHHREDVPHACGIDRGLAPMESTSSDLTSSDL